jgi:hypothetical protein
MDIAVNQRRSSRFLTCHIAPFYAPSILQLENGHTIPKANLDTYALQAVVNLTIIKSAQKG